MPTCAGKDEPSRIGSEPVESIDLQFGEVVDVDIGDVAAFGADGVVMIVGVRVEPCWSRTDRHELQLAHRGKVVECVIDRSQRDPGHQFAGLRVENLCRRVHCIAVKQTKQKLALRSQLEALLAKRITELRWTTHTRTILQDLLINNACK